MADLKQRAVKHLAYARRWLERAEHAYGQKRDIRGELDLILAQAEIEHAKEISQVRRPRFFVAVLRHAAAIVIAAAVVGAGAWGASFWLHRPVPVQPVPAAEHSVTATLPPGQPSPAEPVAPPPAHVPVQAAAPAAAPSAAAQVPVPAPTAVPAYQPAADDRHEPAVSAAVPVSPQEMRQLVRTADKALRGQ